MERQVARVEYVNGYADAYDARGVILSRQRCDKLIGYGPEGYVVMRGNCYWVHKANGCNVLPPMIPYNFEKPSFRSSLTRARSCPICNRRQGTHVP